MGMAFYESRCLSCPTIAFTNKRNCWCRGIYQTITHLPYRRIVDQNRVGQNLSYCGLAERTDNPREYRYFATGYKPMRFVNCEDCILMLAETLMDRLPPDWRPTEAIPEDHYAL